MSQEQVTNYLAELGLADHILVFEQSSATVADAAKAVGCSEAEIGKTLSFLVAQGPILIVFAGDAKIDNKKFKAYFKKRAKMLPADQVEALIGHAPGGVCPFAIKPGVQVYLDESLKRFTHVYPAAGSSNSAVKLTLAQLERAAQPQDWLDVAKFE